MRHVPVPAYLLAALVETAKRVTPRGSDDEVHLHRLVVEGERLLGHPRADAT